MNLITQESTIIFTANNVIGTDLESGVIQHTSPDSFPSASQNTSKCTFPNSARIIFTYFSVTNLFKFFSFCLFPITIGLVSLLRYSNNESLNGNAFIGWMNRLFKGFSLLIFLIFYISIQSISLFHKKTKLNYNAHRNIIGQNPPAQTNNLPNSTTENNPKEKKNSRMYLIAVFRVVLICGYWLFMTQTMIFSKDSFFDFLQRVSKSKFDVSGHVFVCTIYLMCLAIELWYLYLRGSYKVWIWLLVATIIIPVLIFFYMMMLVTCMFYHTYWEKIVGWAFGSGLWIILYSVD